jgi:hypothetical protein
MAKGRTMGLAQNLEGLQRRGRASPHIRRRSRNFTALKELFVQSQSGRLCLKSQNRRLFRVSLFTDFVGTTQLSDFLRPFIIAVRP